MLTHEQAREISRLILICLIAMLIAPNLLTLLIFSGIQIWIAVEVARRGVEPYQD